MLGKKNVGSEYGLGSRDDRNPALSGPTDAPGDDKEAMEKDDDVATINILKSSVEGGGDGVGEKVSTPLSTLTETQIFARAGLKRTPPQGAQQQLHRVASLTEISPAMGSRSSKRRAMSSPELDTSSWLVPGEALEKLQGKVEDLALYCQKNKNVHKEVKAVAVELRGLVRRALKRSVRPEGGRTSTGDTESEEIQDLRLENKRPEDAITEPHAPAREVAELRAENLELRQRLGHENEALKIENAMIKRQLGEALKRIKAIEDRAGSEDQKTEGAVEECLMRTGARTFEDLQKIVSRAWPETVFNRVAVRETGVLSIPDGEDVAIPTSRDLGPEKGIYKRLKDRYREMEYLRETLGPKGNTTYLINRIGIPGATEVEYRDRYVYLMVQTEAAGDPPMDKDVYDAACALRDKLIEHGRARVSVPVFREKDLENTRKILEYVFHPTLIEVEIYCLSGKKARTAKKQGKERETTPVERGPKATGGDRRKQEAVIVESGGQSYAKLLKTIKDKVSPKELGIDIRQLRRTRAGDILITTDGRAGDADKLRQALATNVEGLTVRKGSREEVTFHIRDLDATVNREDMRDALVAEGVPEDALKVTSLRPAFGDTQVATVKVAKSYSEALVNKKRILIGWTRCRVQKRVPMQGCGKCWGMGHNRSDCKGPDRTELCRRCGQAGHVAVKCVGDPYCLECGGGGHQTGAARCPRNGGTRGETEVPNANSGQC